MKHTITKKQWNIVFIKIDFDNLQSKNIMFAVWDYHDKYGNSLIQSLTNHCKKLFWKTFDYEWIKDWKTISIQLHEEIQDYVLEKMKDLDLFEWIRQKKKDFNDYLRDYLHKTFFDGKIERRYKLLETFVEVAEKPESFNLTIDWLMKMPNKELAKLLVWIIDRKEKKGDKVFNFFNK